MPRGTCYTRYTMLPDSIIIADVDIVSRIYKY